MKVVFASTPGQEAKIRELTRYFYSDVFPVFFNDQDIAEFEQLMVLHTTREHFDSFNTLGEAFRVITSLQTLISILESGKISEQYETVFKKNVCTLKSYGIYFPFTFRQFLQAKTAHHPYLSVYSKAANSLLC
ncbi:YhcU family protein [Bacillus sp. T33-2]|uniref:YhcU family protein n=1 Tax=Bacillus sp. T33-2 TaxID=2054168 RepID=UPI000C7908F5|nr:YhcU family protein [Bacillus sp. T33-2]PLR97856.1 hypothetical protein CVD19_06885 [Bacillus sp. T33-2]